MRSKLKVITIGLVALITVASLLAYYFLKPMVDTSQHEAIAIAEKQLLNETTVFASYINVKKIHYLYTNFIDKSTKDKNSFTAQKPIQVSDFASFIKKVDAEGIPLLQQIDSAFVLASIPNLDNVEEKNDALKPTQKDLQKTFLLTGKFEKEKLAEALTKHMLAFKISKNEYIYRVTPPQNIETCKQEETFDIMIENDIIIITSKGQIRPTLQLLTSPTKPHKDLKSWQAYREGKLFSLAIFNPQYASTAIENRFVKMILSSEGAQKELNPFQKAFAGVDLNLIKQSVNANLKLWSNKQHVKATEKTFSEFMDKTKNNFPSQPAEMMIYKNLLDTLHSKTHGNMWNFDITLNKSHVDSLKTLPQNLMSMMLGDMGINITSKTNDNANTTADNLADEKSLIVYQKTLNIDSLNTSAIDLYNFKGLKLGPFIISANKEPRSPFNKPKKDDSKRVYIRVESGILPNLNIDMHTLEGNERAKIYIETLTDKDGSNLLKIESCGPNRNDSPLPLMSIPYTHYENSIATSHTRMSVEKELKLAKGIAFKEAHEVKGYIQLRIPSMTEEVILPARANEHYEYKNSSFTLNQAEYKNLTYTLTGQTDTFLNVIPLNQNKKVIEANGKSSVRNQITQYVEGTPKFVKLIIATQEQIRAYPFTLNIKHEDE